MTQIILKNKNSTGSVPATTDLVPGEVALNLADTRLFCLSGDGLSVVQLAGSGYDHSELGNLDVGDDHTQYIFDAPTSSFRNTIAPAADVVDLTLQRFSSTQASSIQSWSTETGLPLSWVAADGSFNGPGSGLTNLNASNLATGTVPTAVLGSGPANNTTFLRGDHTWNTLAADSVDGVGVTGSVQYMGATGQLAGDANLVWDTTGQVLNAPSFAGSGANLTALNATAITTGMVGTTFLGTGTANSTVYLRGDGTWAPINGSSVVVPGVTGSIMFRDATTHLGADANLWWDATNGVLNATSFAGTGTALIDLDADNLTTGMVATNILGTGTADATTFLRGDGTWQTMSGGSTSTSTYVLNTADSNLPNAQVLASLITGMVKVTTGTGLLSTAVAGTDYLLPTGDGSQLTGIVTLDDDQTLTGDVTFTGTVTVDNLTGYITAANGLLSAQAVPIPATDIADLDTSKIVSGTFATARLGTGTADTTTFLRGDGTWTSVANIPNASAAYWVKVGDPTIPNAVDMSLIGVGILMNQATGAPTIAVAGTDYLTPTGDGSGLTNLHWAQVVDFTNGVETVPLNDLALPTGPIDMATHGITNLAPPTQANDAATKAYVDASSAGQTVLSPVDAASTADLPLSGGAVLSVDGVILNNGDSVLLKDQTDPVENGIYDVSGIGVGYTLIRSAEMASGSTALSGSYVFVMGGTTNGGSSYILTTNNPITVDTTDQTWTQYSSASAPSAGYGIDVNGNQISIDTTWPGQTAITTIGTIVTGTWQGTPVGATFGGTGLTTVAAGDMIFGSALNTWANLAKGTPNQIMMMDANGDFPIWGDIIDGGTW